METLGDGDFQKKQIIGGDALEGYLGTTGWAFALEGYLGTAGWASAVFAS